MNRINENEQIWPFAEFCKYTDQSRFKRLEINRSKQVQKVWNYLLKIVSSGLKLIEQRSFKRFLNKLSEIVSNSLTLLDQSNFKRLETTWTSSFKRLETNRTSSFKRRETNWTISFKRLETTCVQFVGEIFENTWFLFETTFKFILNCFEVVSSGLELIDPSLWLVGYSPGLPLELKLFWISEFWVFFILKFKISQALLMLFWSFH